MKKINCISSPRNISTALMYSFLQRPDTCAFDEPFYAYYLHTTGRQHPGFAEILRSQPLDPIQVFEELDASTCPVLYVKNMAHHMRLLDPDDFMEYDTLLLLRNPRQLIASFAQVIPDPDMDDIGIRDQFRLYEHYRSTGANVCIVDSGELLKNPGQVLADLCDSLGITFFKSMLSWNAGPREEDGVWAPYWYSNVHKSTGFSSQDTSARPLPERCEALLEEALPYYSELYSHSIKAV